MAETPRAQALPLPTIVVDPSVAPTDPPRRKPPTLASKTHLRTVELGTDPRLSWISVSRYSLSRLSLTERVHMELRDLGAIEILVGLIEMVFGIPLIFAESYAYPAVIGIPWVTGVWYVVSGSLVIHLIHSRSQSHKRVVLGTHALSALAAALGCVVHLLSLFHLQTTPYNYLTAPLLLSFVLMTFSLLEFILALLICCLYLTLLPRRGW